MPRYLLNATYTIQGVEGVRSKGGTDRRAAVTDAAHSVGGELESFYFAFGDRDVVAIVDLPDDKAAAAVGLIVNAAGGARVNPTVGWGPSAMGPPVVSRPLCGGSHSWRRRRGPADGHGAFVGRASSCPQRP